MQNNEYYKQKIGDKCVYSYENCLLNRFNRSCGPSEKEKHRKKILSLFSLRTGRAGRRKPNFTNMSTKGKIIGLIAFVVAVALAIFVYVRFFFVFGDGVKAGELNQFTLKGYVFKTYEGRIIQAGFRGGVNSGMADANSLGSYVFDFSCDNKVVADSLMRCSGKMVEVHYKEYLGALPWRGMQKHIVDRIISVSDTK